MGRVALAKFSYLTFDCYGTLIDWRNGLESHLGTLLRSKGLPLETSVYPVYVKLEAQQEGTYKPYKEILSDTALLVADSFHLSLTGAEAQEFAEAVPRWKPFKDTVESLRELGELGYKRIILSNIDRDLLSETILRNNLAVDGYVTAEDVGSYKPALGHWTRFFEEYKVSKGETLHVAQSVYHDIVPSSRIGLANAWINRYGDTKPREINPTYICSDLIGLQHVLQ